MITFPLKRYRTIVVDPPWPYKNYPPAIQPPYSLMSLEEIDGLPVASIAETNSHLYLWVTNALIAEGLQILEHWGFAYKTVITWAKHQVGLGSYYRNSTEQVLFAVRGRLPVLCRSQRNWFLADRRQHSRKPDEFYRIVESMSPSPRIDVFSREKRPGWDQFGNQCDFFKSDHRGNKENARAETTEAAGSGANPRSVDPHALRLDERPQGAISQGGEAPKIQSGGT